MPSREETQQIIWQKTIQLGKMSSAIDRLPESKVRSDLLVKHTALFNEIDRLNQAIDNTGLDICYYGFVPKCPQCQCAVCPAWLEKQQGLNKHNEEDV